MLCDLSCAQDPLLDQLAVSDHRAGEAAACGDLCHASILSLAGLASYAVYSGLVTDNFITRRTEDINTSEL